MLQLEVWQRRLDDTLPVSFLTIVIITIVVITLTDIIIIIVIIVGIRELDSYF